MKRLLPSVLVLVFSAACASQKGVAVGETSVTPNTTQLIVGSSSVNSLSVGMTSSTTSIATSVPTSQDSTYQLVRRVYAELEIPVSIENGSSRSVGNETMKVRRRLAGLTMQNIVDCGEKMGLRNAETWDIEMNLLTYVQKDAAGTGAVVMTRIQALGHDPSLSTRESATCSTTGELEAKIGRLVKLKATSK